jgi:isopenicillin N synthase-like dioxygenase
MAFSLEPLAYTSKDFSTRFARMLRQEGFAVLTSHPCDLAAFHEARQSALEFFQLPARVKQQYIRPEAGFELGYVPYHFERTRKITGPRAYDPPNLNEYFHVGRLLDPPVIREGFTFYGENRYPVEVPRLGPAADRLFASLETVAQSLLGTLAGQLGLPQGYFDGLNRDGLSKMRILYYPSLPAKPAPGALRAQAHEDKCLLTILLGADEDRDLQILSPTTGRWESLDVPKGAAVINLGKKLTYLTNGLLPSTKHRVIVPADHRRARTTIPFFSHPHPDTTLTPLPGVGEPGANPFLAEYGPTLDVCQNNLQLLRRNVERYRQAGNPGGM